MKSIVHTYHPPERISHMMPQSDFTWEISRNTLVIVDLVMGNMSVTNDIHRILRYIHEQIGIIAFDDLKVVIYRDSDGYFDGVKCLSESRRFYSLARNVDGKMIREKNMITAIKRALDELKIYPLEHESF